MLAQGFEFCAENHAQSSSPGQTPKEEQVNIKEGRWVEHLEHQEH
jgi:hypothetical protein